MKLRAFTLIELLVVIAIIALLAGMILTGIPAIKFRAKTLDTAQRMQAVLTGLSQVGQADGQTAYDIQKDSLKDDFRWASLRQILLSLDLKSDPVNIPPYIKLRMAYDGGSNPAINGGDYSLDSQICWLQRDLQNKVTYPPGGKDFTWWWTVPPRDLYCQFSWYQMITITQWPSPVGETLDSTLEVLPDANPPAKNTDWYFARWPSLVTDEAWPKSDWENGGKPPRWSAPWGKPFFNRNSATVGDQIQSHTLSELTPLDTIPLLQSAGILEAGTAGADAFRTDRGTHRPWNDNWGNPLIVTNAVFTAPRFDFLDGQSSSDLQKGRDFILKTYQLSYGYGRSIYLAVGAAGPILATPLPSKWEAGDDAKTIKELWLQIRETCDAKKWTEKSFQKPPWSGTSNGKMGDKRCFLTAPIELR